MLTCKSPRKVMLVAHYFAEQALPKYSSRFSRHDFTLPQLFACLVAKELLKRSYRSAEATLRDSEHWCRAIGMSRAPDHNTLCRAARLLLSQRGTDKLLDVLVRWMDLHHALGLGDKPLAIDSTYCQSRHVSRHYERRCAKARVNLRKRRKKGRSRTVKQLPKLAVSVSCASHFILSIWCGTGAGSDHTHFERVLFDAWRRVKRRSFTNVNDAGYDSEANHQIARQDMGIRSIIPPLIGRQSEKSPLGKWRRRMRRLLSTRRGRKRSGYTQRWQAETGMSMMKRNLGDELSGKTAASRKHDLRLKALTHNLMIIRRRRGSRQSRPAPIPCLENVIAEPASRPISELRKVSIPPFDIREGPVLDLSSAWDKLIDADVKQAILK